MSRLTQAEDIRRLLEVDRVWSIYALGDLTPGFFEHSEWYSAPPVDGRAAPMVLLYRAFATPVIFAIGEPDRVRVVLDEIAGEPEMYLSIRPEILPLIKQDYRVEHETAMWRMFVEPGDYRPARPGPPGSAAGPVERLSSDDLPALRALYDDGLPAGESPDFFSPAILAQGAFYGIREGEDLIAAAGTHLVSEQESVGAVGNVYTRRDRRGRGLAAQTTSAVTAELLRLGLRTIALNVNQANDRAIRVYERLGFVKYCPFIEGVAYRN
jgi:GNAT superfamily N-acetyltransferase